MLDAGVDRSRRTRAAHAHARPLLRAREPGRNGAAGWREARSRAWVLGTLPSSTAYGVCFLAATLFVGLSWIALRLVREPPAATAPAEADFWTHLGSVPALLRENTNFTWYLVARMLSFGAVIGSGFFTVYALRVLQRAEADVGPVHRADARRADGRPAPPRLGRRSARAIASCS